MSSNTRATANRFGKLMALSLVAGLAGIFTLTLAIEAVAANSSSTGSGHVVDFLIKVDSGKSASAMKTLKGLTAQVGGQAETLTGRLHDDSHWVSIKAPTKSIRLSMKALQAIPGVRLVQPNYPIRLLNDYRIQDARQRDALANTLRKAGMKTADGRTVDQVLAGVPSSKAKPDNPPIPAVKAPGTGADGLANNQWGMIDNGVVNAWKGNRGEGVVVAVLDSGVDYTHEDLVDNMWRNPGEMGLDGQGRDKSSNGVDDDGNGYIDDVVGWDFVTDDNKPYDLSVDPMDLLFGGGNPGHGTHCAGNVAARGDNGKGIHGVAPKAKIMALRFLSEKGEGSTEAAIKAIAYSIKMGVRVSSNSWGSSGEDPNDAVGNQALRDIIEEARLAGQLFVAAAGNGDAQGRGYDNDTSKMPAYPASYPHDNIVSVAALDKADTLGTFSNWGATTVDMGAPGVAVYSTTVGNGYSDKVIDFPQFGLTVTWDGTSMAAPHVSGAAALYLSDNPKATVEELKAAVMKATKPINNLSSKATTNGKLSVEKL